MFLVTVILKSTPHVLQFHFDKYADGEKMLNRYAEADPLLSIDDNYGSKSLIDIQEIAGVFLTDLSREMAAHEAVEVEKHRKDIRVNKRMQAEQQSGIVAPRMMSN